MAARPKPAAAPKTIDAYLNGVRDGAREALQTLRTRIHAVAPRAEECISYSIPAFRLDGALLVGFGAATHHCSFYPMSSALIDAHQADLASYQTSRGAIRFSPEDPLPAGLVRKLVKARIAENAARPTKASAATKPDRSPSTRSKKKEPTTASLPPAPPGAKTTLAAGRRNPDVTALLDAGSTERREQIEELRGLLLDASPGVSEIVKWNSPSYRTVEDFATIHARPGKPPQVVLHLGAKVKDGSTVGLTIDDPDRLLEWRSRDRAIVTLPGTLTPALRSTLASLFGRWVAESERLGSSKKGDEPTIRAAKTEPRRPRARASR